MEYSNIDKINALIQERRSITAAMQSFDQGGRILGMSVGRPPPPDMAGRPGFMMGAIVDVGHMDYPPQMVDQIRSSFAARQQAITNELQQLGVQGVE